VLHGFNSVILRLFGTWTIF